MTPAATPDAEALARVQALAAGRRAGAEKEARRERSQNYEKRLRSNLEFATVGSIPLLDLEAVLALAAKPVAALAGGEIDYFQQNHGWNGLWGQVVDEAAGQPGVVAFQRLSTPPPPAGDRPASVMEKANDGTSVGNGASGDRPADVGLSAEELDTIVRLNDWYGSRNERFQRLFKRLIAARSTLSPKGEEALREALSAAYEGTSLKAWCEARGVNRNHANEFENGKRGPGGDLLRALGFRVAYLPTPVAKPDEVGS